MDYTKRLRIISYLAMVCAGLLLLAQPLSQTLAVRHSANAGENSDPKPTGPPPAVTTNPDLDREIELLEKFTDDLGSFHERSAQLRRKSALTRAEFDSANAAANDLKRRLAQVLQAVQSGINKLKGAGRFDKLDSDLSALNDIKLRNVIRRLGGAGNLIENAASRLNGPGPANEILALIEQLRPKVTAQANALLYEREAGPFNLSAVPVAYHRTEPSIVASSVKCDLSAVRLIWIAIKFPPDLYPPKPGELGYNRWRRASEAVDRNCVETQ